MARSRSPARLDSDGPGVSRAFGKYFKTDDAPAYKKWMDLRHDQHNGSVKRAQEEHRNISASPARSKSPSIRSRSVRGSPPSATKGDVVRPPLYPAVRDSYI